VTSTTTLPSDRPAEPSTAFITSDGTGVPVTTSSDTVVDVPNASLSQLQTGASTIAVGHVGTGGTL
jgi:hypothetical protein